MGRRLTLTGTKLTDTTAPRLLLGDPMRTTGSLLLVDPAHPDNPWPAGAPVTGALLPNLAEAQAKAMLGPVDVSAKWANVGATTVKRTSTGAVYTSGAFVGPVHSAPIIQWIIDNPSHTFFVSVWGDADGATPNRTTLLKTNGTGTGRAYEAFAAAPQVGGTLVNSAGFPVGVGAFRSALAFSGHNIVGATAADVLAKNGSALFGTYGDLGSSARRSYRYYLEDLTVSGRSWAQANALDADTYRAEVQTAGGRYYGDIVPA